MEGAGTGSIGLRLALLVIMAMGTILLIIGSRAHGGHRPHAGRQYGHQHGGLVGPDGRLGGGGIERHGA